MIGIEANEARGGRNHHLPYLMNKFDINIQSLLDNVRVNKRANGGGNVIWADVVAICRDQFSGVALMPSSVIGSSNSTLTENRTLGSIGLASSDGAATFTKQAASSN